MFTENFNSLMSVFDRNYLLLKFVDKNNNNIIIFLIYIFKYKLTSISHDVRMSRANLRLNYYFVDNNLFIQFSKTKNDNWLGINHLKKIKLNELYVAAFTYKGVSTLKYWNAVFYQSDAFVIFNILQVLLIHSKSFFFTKTNNFQISQFS